LTVAARTVHGSDLPRIGVDVDPAPLLELREDARALDIVLMPWQEYVLGIAEATNADGSYLFGEVADVVARQNGKSTKLAPLIRRRMRQGRRVLHAAQDRIIPQRIFKRVAASFPRSEARIRLANGQEEISLPNGASYKIVASQRSGVRGNDADDLIIDELREQKDNEFIDAAKPTVIASANPQILYMSNAGSLESIVLNALRSRQKDPGLAYMEWSAAPDLDTADVEGWAQANPALGRSNITLERLQSAYSSFRESGNLAGWETEHLCRWVTSMAPKLVQDIHWQLCRKPTVPPVRPAMGISVTPDGTRASAVLSWAQGDGSQGLMVLADVRGSPLDIDSFAADLGPLAAEAGVQAVGFDPWTDQQLARHFPVSESITGQVFANASERFVRAVETQKLHWTFADQVSEDLPYTSRKNGTGTSFMAERADPKRPITAALAAIRAVWLASDPGLGPPSVY
jgi:hypothetical protein